MMILTMPWHLVGLLGAPRRMAYYDYTIRPCIRTACWC
jgi:cytochrome c oxidase subunit 1